MKNKNVELSKTDLAKLDLWTARDMDFVAEKGKGIETIPRYTKCHKPKYTNDIKRYLMNMEEKSMFRPRDKPFAVAVELEGLLRYVWRTDLLTQKEYDAARKADKAALGVLRQKRQRPVGESRIIGGTDQG